MAPKTTMSSAAFYTLLLVTLMMGANHGVDVATAVVLTQQHTVNMDGRLRTAFAMGLVDVLALSMVGAQKRLAAAHRPRQLVVAAVMVLGLHDEFDSYWRLLREG